MGHPAERERNYGKEKSAREICHPDSEEVGRMKLRCDNQPCGKPVKQVDIRLGLAGEQAQHKASTVINKHKSLCCYSTRELGQA